MSLKNQQGFTLIELLIVVLIIGILAAIAVPQYQKAVKKAELMKYVAIVDTLYKAEEDYYLTHGAYTQDVRNLLITIPTVGRVTYTTSNFQGFVSCYEGTRLLFKYGVYDYVTNVQAGTDAMRYLKFIQDDKRTYKVKKGTRACFARGIPARNACLAAGPWAKELKNANGWDYQYLSAQ